jgi:hypothetical protein
MKNSNVRILVGLIIFSAFLLCTACKNGTEPRNNNDNKPPPTEEANTTNNVTNAKTETETETESLAAIPPCTETAILDAIDKDINFKKARKRTGIDSLSVSYNSNTKTLHVKGMIKGKAGSFGRLLKSIKDFQGKRGAGKVPCVMKAIYGKNSFGWEWCPYECDGICKQTKCGPPS